MQLISFSLKDIQDEQCTISDDSIGNLVKRQKELPIVLAAVVSKIENKITHTNKDHYDFFDALKLNHHFALSGSFNNPNANLVCEKVVYLWNRLNRNEFIGFTEFDAKTHRETIDKILLETDELASACQAEGISTRISTQIILAQKQYKENNLWIKQIYCEFSQREFEMRKINSRTFKKSLQALFKLTKDPLLHSCICFDEMKTSSFVHLELNKILDNNPEDLLALTLKGWLYAGGSAMVDTDQKEAKICLERAIKMNPNNPSAWFSLKKCDKKWALEFIKEFIEKDPNQPTLLAVYGRMQAESGPGIIPDYKLSLEYLEKALSLDQDNAFALESLAIVFTNMGDEKQAYIYYKRLLALDPESSYAHSVVGACLLLEDDAQAYIHLLRALELDPDNVQANFTLGSLLRSGSENVPKDLKRALMHLKKVIELFPKYPSAHVEIGYLLLRSNDESIPKDRKQAYYHLKCAVELGSLDSVAYLNLGALLLEGGDGIRINLKDSYRYLLKAKELNPKNYAAYFYLGNLLMDGGGDIPKDLKQANEYYMNALDLEPTSHDAHFRLYLLYKDGGEGITKDLRKAFKHLKSAHEIKPDNIHISALFQNFIDEEEWTFLQEFYKEFYEATKQETVSSITYGRIGEFLRIGGEGVIQNDEEAYKNFMKALELDPENDFVHARLGELLRTGGEGVPQSIEEAYAHLKQALELNPNNNFAKAKFSLIKHKEQPEKKE